jgi:hypothetical protein
VGKGKNVDREGKIGLIGGLRLNFRFAFWVSLLRFGFFVADEREAALEFGGKVCVFGGDVDGLAGFLSEPGVEFRRSGRDEAALAAERHSLRRPALDYGCGLAQECCDLLPAFQSLWLSRLPVGTLWHARLDADFSRAFAAEECGAINAID